MKTHILKTWPLYFERVNNGQKQFEVRKNDRDFQTGDIVKLQEYDNVTEGYTGQELDFVITYILYGGNFGIQSGYCVLQLAPITE